MLNALHVQLSTAGVASDHKLSNLKQYKCNSLEFWRSEVQIDFSGLNSRYQQGCISFQSSRGTSISLPFPASRGCPHSLASGLFLHLPKQAMLAEFFPYCTILTSSPASVFHFKSPCDYTGPPRLSRKISLSQGQLINSFNSIFIWVDDMLSGKDAY